MDEKNEFKVSPPPKEFITLMREKLAKVSPESILKLSQGLERSLKVADSIDGNGEQNKIAEVLTRVMTRLSGLHEINLGELTIRFSPAGLKFTINHKEAGDLSWLDFDKIRGDIGPGQCFVHPYLIETVTHNLIRAIKFLRKQFPGMTLLEGKLAAEKLRTILAKGTVPTYSEIFAEGAPHLMYTAPADADPSDI